MSIKVQSLLTEKAKRFGSSESASDFQACFMDALNYTLNDIDEALGLTTSAVTSTSGSIDLDEQKYRMLISYGLDMHISEGNEWPIAPTGDLVRRWRDKMSMRHVNYMKEQSSKGGLGDVDEDLSGN